MWRQTLNTLKFLRSTSTTTSHLAPYKFQPTVCQPYAYRSFSQPTKDSQQALEDTQISCLTLHPVTWPNHGPQIELYHAEEAIGLVKSLNWEVVKGPLWQVDDETPLKSQELLALESEHFENYFDERDINAYKQGNRKGIPIDIRKNKQMMKQENIKDGDYLYGPSDLRGVYFKKGGLIMELDENDEHSDMYDEWKNELLRESIAKSSLIKVRKIHSSTYFTKGKLNDIGYFIKENEDINVVYINSQLTALQQKKLEKRFNDIILSRDDKLRKYYLKSAQKEKFNPTDVESDSTQMSDMEDSSEHSQRQQQRKIRIIDRFGMILQIFAQRAKSRGAQLQIELAWLKYARTMLVRGGAPTFGQLGNIFQGNMMRLDISEMEIKSARGRKSGSSGVMGGEGETQLEIERRRIGDREAKILKELQDLERRSQHEKSKKEAAHQSLPLIALIGYTNAGKTALTNLMTGSQLESKDLLFQTLNTTNKRFRLPNGQQGLMTDTVGFITNLPHGLVESFKSTLEEIHFADIVVHVRDISHPHTNYQRKTVLKVLKEIGIPEESLKEKYIEVWNKIDLLGEEELERLKSEVEQEQSQSQECINQEDTEKDHSSTKQDQFPIIMMSCTEGTGKQQFLTTLEDLSSSLMGKKLTAITYPYFLHDKITKWFNENASITTFDNMEFNYDEKNDGGNLITIKVPIDDVVYQQYKKKFMNEDGGYDYSQNTKQSQKNQSQNKGDWQQKQYKGSNDRGLQQKTKSNKLKPPPGWND